MRLSRLNIAILSVWIVLYTSSLSIKMPVSKNKPAIKHSEVDDDDDDDSFFDSPSTETQEQSKPTNKSNLSDPKKVETFQDFQSQLNKDTDHKHTNEIKNPTKIKEHSNAKESINELNGSIHMSLPSNLQDDTTAKHSHNTPKLNSSPIKDTKINVLVNDHKIVKSNLPDSKKPQESHNKNHINEEVRVDKSPLIANPPIKQTLTDKPYNNKEGRHKQDIHQQVQKVTLSEEHKLEPVKNSITEVKSESHEKQRANTNDHTGQFVPKIEQKPIDEKFFQDSAPKDNEQVYKPKAKEKKYEPVEISKYLNLEKNPNSYQDVTYNSGSFNVNNKDANSKQNEIVSSEDHTNKNKNDNGRYVILF